MENVDIWLVSLLGVEIRTAEVGIISLWTDGMPPSLEEILGFGEDSDFEEMLSSKINRFGQLKRERWGKGLRLSSIPACSQMV